MTGRAIRIATGVLLLAFSLLPVFRILGPSEDSPFRRTSVEVAEATLQYILWGAFTAVLVGVLLAFLSPGDRLAAPLRRAGDRLARIPTVRWAWGLAALAGLLAWGAGRILFRGFYTNVDEIASALQARYFAEGALSGPVLELPEAWLIPNMLMVDAGWVSQFPPSHLVLMALGIAIGAPMIVGPLLFATTAGLSALVFPRLLPDSPGAARLAPLLVAMSPFLVFIGGGALSHTSAGAFGMLALWAALRARDGHAGWSVLAGAAVGVMVSSRPWIGIVLGTTVTAGIWLPMLTERVGPGPMGFARRSLGTIAGGAPFAVLLGAYNQALFGSPTTVGYLATFGERHQLGFHNDPWGQDYGLVEAVGFTSSDLLSFGTQLLETPIPVGVVIGLWLLTARSVPRGTGFLLAWAFLPVLSNGLYWFHSTRMLYEGAPAWLALACLGMATLVRAPEAAVQPPPDAEPAPERRLELRGIALWSIAASVVVALVLGIPGRVGGFLWSEDTLARVTVPEIPDDDPALVFVHASWNERLSASLQGAGGMRQDTVITVLRRNTNCGLHQYALAREAGTEPLPEIDLLAVPGTPDDIERPPAPEGTTLRAREGEVFPAPCLRELNADRFGAVALAPLLWQGDLPGIEEGKPLFVRDLGPEKNERIRAAWPDRTPWVFVPKADGAAPELVPYEEAMWVLWGVDGPDAAGG